MQVARRDKGLLFFISFCLLLSYSGSARSNHTLRIHILSRHAPRKVTITAPGGYFFAGSKTLMPGHDSVTVSTKEGLISLRSGNMFFHSKSPVEISSPKIFSIEFITGKTIKKRHYRGGLTLYPGKTSLLIVNRVKLEGYVHDASRAELGELVSRSSKNCQPGWRRELISAMEIAIRSYILHMKNRHTDSRYQFCDLTHCLHYPGTTPPPERPEQMPGMSLSPGQVILNDQGKPHAAYFHSSSGGRLSGPEVLWHGHCRDSHYRRGNDSLPGEAPLSRRSPHEKWQVTIAKKRLSKIFGLSRIRSITLEQKQKRVSAIIFKTEKGTKRISAAVFLSRAGRALGWGEVKSNDFTVTPAGEKFIFTGRGLGHGIGMSQWSARALACRGWKAHRILSFFYNEPEIVVWHR